ncbi:MAG: LPS export ABC transporter periplasmic protein LptC [Acidiferrobacterales bacterium]
MDRKRLAILSVVLGFTIFLWWLSTALSLPDRTIVTGAPDTPDYIVDGLNVVQTNANGKKKFTLSAKRMSHYPSEKLARLEKAYLVQYQSDGVTIHTSADRARYPDNGQELYMEKNVRIIRKKNGKVLSDIRSNSTRVILQ